MSLTDVDPNFDQGCRRNDDGVCEHCGRVLEPWDWFICPRLLNPHFRQPDELELRQPLGLGDYSEALLKSIGITEDRYKEAKKLFGLPPTCGCSTRKAWLNKVSDWWNERREGSMPRSRSADLSDPFSTINAYTRIT